jgi:hypothetical protein
MMQRRVKIVVAITVVAIMVFLTNFTVQISGHRSFGELTQATWIYLENAFEYYLGIPLPYSDFLAKLFTLFGGFLVVALTLYIITEVF